MWSRCLVLLTIVAGVTSWSHVSPHRFDTPWTLRSVARFASGEPGNASYGFTAALKRVMSGDMRKRDFLSSRVERVSDKAKIGAKFLARKIDPQSDCKSDEECLVEIETAGIISE